MNHPELIAVPVLMLADYALTILGAKTSAVVYRNHFTMPSYELNPGQMRPRNVNNSSDRSLIPATRRKRTL